MQMKSNKNLNVASLSVLCVVAALMASFCLIHYPLPDDFEEPWKYRLIKFGSELANALAHYLERMGIVHQVNVTRFSYHMSYGSFSIRDSRDNITVTDETIDHLRIRIFKPSRPSDDNGLYTTILFYHGGGYLLGSADIFEPVTYLLAKYTGFQVIYVEYRLIPEHKYPAAYNDSLEAALYLIKNSPKYKIDLKNFILMGDSAGGNLATVVSQNLIELGVLKPRLQVLVYPILQFFDFTLPSYQLYLPQSVLGSINRENFKKFLHYFTGDLVDDEIFSNGHTSQLQKEMFTRYVNHGYLPSSKNANKHPTRQEHINDTNNKYARLTEIILSKNVSPLLADDAYLERNSPDMTILITVEMDILRDDGFIYSKRLQSVGKHCVHKHYPSIFHGVFGLVHGPFRFRKGHEMVKHVSAMIKKAIG